MPVIPAIAKPNNLLKDNFVCVESSPEHLKLTKEHVTKTEKEIETADKTAISSNIGSYKLCHTAPSLLYEKATTDKKHKILRILCFFVCLSCVFAIEQNL